MRKAHELHFNIDLPQLIVEISSNNELHGMLVPLRIAQKKLELIAKRATELNDPILNILMLETKLYGVDNHSDISELVNEQKKLITQE